MAETPECPECGAHIQLADDIMANEILSCGDCGVELEVTSLSPPSLAVAPQEEEDWGE